MTKESLSQNGSIVRNDMAYITKKTTTSGVKPIGSNLFGSCSTASGTAQKNVTMADFDVLVEGVTIHVYFENGNEADNPTLKVGSTQAMPIVRCVFVHLL